MHYKLPKFSSRAFLAPMAGISDPALRLLCKQKGAGLVVTELTSIHSIVAKEAELKKRARGIPDFIEFSEQERPVSVQLFGSDLNILERAAKIVAPYFDIIDYNMGCPAPHITQQMAGGALLQESNLTRRIFRTLVNAVERPVTLKIRCGVTSASRHLFRDIAQIAQDEGVQMVTLHPRTVSQGYSGTADWSLIKELKRLVRIPVVGNGDITAPEDAKNMLEQTGCDYVMVGRGAMGNPLIFEQINEMLEHGRCRARTSGERLETFFEYIHIAKRFRIKFSNIKVQAFKFTRGLPESTKIRSRIAMARTTDDLEGIMRRIPAGAEDPARCGKMVLSATAASH